jgi:hypothetical protein
MSPTDARLEGIRRITELLVELSAEDGMSPVESRDLADSMGDVAEMVWDRLGLEVLDASDPSVVTARLRLT